jgi:hypothetical protein
MSEERIATLERDINALQISEAKMSVSVEHLASAVAKLDETVGGLRDSMNQGRGALWGISASAALLGGAAAVAAQKLFGSG